MALPSSWVRCGFFGCRWPPMVSGGRPQSHAQQLLSQALAEAMDWQVDLHDYDLEVGQWARWNDGVVGLPFLAIKTCYVSSRKMKFLALPKKGFCLEVTMVGCFTTSCDMYHADFLWKAPFIKQ